MQSNTSLQFLTPFEKRTLQKHVKLGKGHLETCLSQEEIDSIFQLTSLPAQAHKKLYLTARELTGQTTLLLNTIFTGIFGAWLGLSGFLELELSSRLVFTTLVTSSLLIGVLIGINSVLQRRKYASSIMDKRKLQDLEMTLLKEINREKEEEIDHKTKELLQKDKKMSRQRVLELLKLVPDESELVSENRFDKNIRKSIRKLSHACTVPEMRLKSWIKGNFNRLIIELIPTILGTVGSLFVYLGGAPAIAKEFGNEALFNFLSLPGVKVGELFLAVIITLYFAYSFFHLNFRGFKREQEIAKMQTALNREENQSTHLNDQLYKIDQLLLSQKSVVA